MWSGAAANRRGAIDSPLSPAQQEQVALWLGRAQGALSERAGAAAWAEGQAMSAEQAVDYALEPAEATSSSAVVPATKTGAAGCLSTCT